MRDPARFSKSDVEHFGSIFLSSAADSKMSRSLPRPPRPPGPPIEGDPDGSRPPPTSYPYAPAGPDVDRRGSLLPAPQEHGSRRGTQSTTSMGEPGSWPSRNISIPRLAGPSGFSPHGRSPSSSDLSASNPARQSPDLRNILSHPDSTRPGQSASAPEPWRTHQREQLPPLSHVLPSEPPSASSRSPYSSPWGANSPKSPRPSSLSATAGYEPVPSQPSPYSERSATRSSVYTPLPGPDRSIRNHPPSTPTYGGSQPRGASDLAYPASYHDRQRHERFSEPAVAGGPRWPPRSEPTASETHPSSYSSASVASVSGGPSQQQDAAAAAIHQVEPPFSGEAIGPSIWTGTHFLPRYMGERLVRGEGMCYFYDDGTHCKTVIDGEPVTAHWGVTKAGKPRKRLAVACLTCREKKIKCDPDYPKCVQCEKFGRVCKFKNAPRGTRTSPDVFAFEEGDHVTAPVPGATVQEPDQYTPDKPLTPREHCFERPEADGPRKRRSSRDLHRHTDSISDVDPLDITRPRQHASKKARHSSPPSEAPSPRTRATLLGPEKSPGRGSFANDMFSPGILTQPSPFNWQIDPFEISYDLAMHLAELYFKHVNTTMVHLFPRRQFMHWLYTCRDKSPDDLMLVYTMLALASNFSSRADRKTFSKDFARIARYAVENSSGHYTMQLAQSRLLLGIHYFALNKTVEAWEFSGSSARTANGLRLNVEGETDDDSTEYGLSRSGYAECRRRTFWAIYLLDRYNGFCSMHNSALDDEDVFIRLPCSDEDFEDQIERHAPTLQDYLTGAIPTDDPSGGHQLGLMAYQVEVSSVWGDVYAENCRSSRRAPEGYASRYESFHGETQRRLDAWSSGLPPELTCTQANMDTSVRSGCVAAFVAMHALYHATAMELNRRVIGQRLRREEVERNIRAQISHAHEFMGIVQTLSNRRERTATGHVESAMLSPFLGHGIVMACDILTAKGLHRDVAGLLSVLNAGIAILDDLRPYWATARAQKGQIVSRADRLHEILAKSPSHYTFAAPPPSGVPPKEETFSMPEPLTARASAQDDLVYSVDIDLYLDAMAGERKESSSSTTGMISTMSLDAA